MKKIVLILIISCILTGNIFAAPTEYYGGVNNEYEYLEYNFLSGKPVKFVGSYTITENEKGDTKTQTYKFKLTPEDKNITGKIDRQITYTTTYTKRNDKGQTIAQTSLSKYKETIELNGDKYDLVDFQFSKSDVIDNRPASDFYSGNMNGRKYYSINKDQGKVIVEISSGNVGYNNFWGSTETQITENIITVEREIESGGRLVKQTWQGTVVSQVSDSTTKVLKYSENEASFSSFQGGYTKITNREMLSRYDYNLPAINTRGNVDPKKRVKDEIQLNIQMVPKIERLIVPKFKDTGGHWAEHYIDKLYSLDVFDEDSQIFAPDIPFTRGDFIKALMNACNLRPQIEEKKTTRNQKKEVEISPFADVSILDKNYIYIKEAYQKGIITGVTKDLFMPNDSLTKAEALCILVRALGFENKAPTPGYRTVFADDVDIPFWAKDSIYVAQEIGLVAGDPYGRIEPNKEITRAEGSAMMVRFLEFLEKDLQKDYRENIILFQ